VLVDGCQGNSDPNALIQFLHRHSKGQPPSSIVDSEFRPPSTIALALTNYSQARNLLKLSGIRYAGQKLNVTIQGQPPSSAPNASSGSSGSTRINDSFTAFIQTRYQSQQQYLNMDDVMSDQNIASIGINIFEHASSDRLGAVLCKLIASLCPNVLLLELAVEC
jgi:hypothetical protein